MKLATFPAMSATQPTSLWTPSHATAHAVVSGRAPGAPIVAVAAVGQVPGNYASSPDSDEGRFCIRVEPGSASGRRITTYT
ncbi:MAG: hypothetical protein ACYDDF_15270, partial [Thermoplasmatota archaeon]